MIFHQQGPCSTRYKSGTGIQYPTLMNDPRRSLSACPHRQFYTLPGLLDSRAAMSNSYRNLNARVPMQGGSLYHFYDGLWYDPAGTWTQDLPCEADTLTTIWSVYSYARSIHVRDLLACPIQEMLQYQHLPMYLTRLWILVARTGYVVSC